MRNTYTAPAVVTSGTVVRETLGPVFGGNEIQGKRLGAGSMGFEL
jgi:hypothetical protein